MKYIPINPQPKTLLPGMKVQMGPDWGKFVVGHIKVTPNSVGVVGRKFKQGWFEVTWDNGYNCVYCYGKTCYDNHFRCEVQVVEPVDEPKAARFKGVIGYWHSTIAHTVTTLLDKPEPLLPKA